MMCRNVVMAHTYKHQWLYWQKHICDNYYYSFPRTHVVLWNAMENYPLDGVMNRLLGNYREMVYRVPPRKSNGPYPEHYSYYKIENRNTKKYYKKRLWRIHRRKWKQELHKNYDTIEKLPKRPSRYEWYVW